MYGTPIVANGTSPVTTVCSPESGSLFNVGQSTVMCTATDAAQRTDTCSFSITVQAPPRSSLTRFLAFGDSITRGEDGSALTAYTGRLHPFQLLPTSQTYPGVLEQLLRSRYTAQTPTVTNAGCQGEGITTTANDGSCGSSAFSRFTSYTGAGTYQAVLIMEGSNDLYGASNLTGTVSGLRAMVANARNLGLRVYLATIPPIDPLGSRGRTYNSQLVPDLNDRIRSLAASEGATLVDVYQAFGGNLSSMSFDGLHPNAAGYTLIANTFFTAIRATLETQPPATAVPLVVQRQVVPLRRSR